MAEPLVVVSTAELRELIAEAVADALAASRPANDTPTLLDRSGLAKALDCSVVTVDRLVRQGMPRLLLGDSPRFELPKVLVWLENRKVQAIGAGSPVAETAENKPDPLTSPGDSCIGVSASTRKSAKTKESRNGDDHG